MLTARLVKLCSREKLCIAKQSSPAKVKNEALLSANNEASSASLKRGALHSKAKLAFKGRDKTAASPCEAPLSGEAILALLIAQKKALKAKLRVSQPKQVNIQFSRVCIWVQLDPGNADF